MSTGANKKARAPSGAGRPRFGDEAMKSHTVRTTDEQWHKLERLGGAAWLRSKIDAAKEPGPF